MAQFCIDEKGYHLGNTCSAKYSMYEMMNEIMREMVQEGTITQVRSSNNYSRKIVHGKGLENIVRGYGYGRLGLEHCESSTFDKLNRKKKARHKMKSTQKKLTK